MKDLSGVRLTADGAAESSSTSMASDVDLVKKTRGFESSFMVK